MSRIRSGSFMEEYAFVKISTLEVYSLHELIMLLFSAQICQLKMTGMLVWTEASDVRESFVFVL